SFSKSHQRSRQLKMVVPRTLVQGDGLARRGFCIRIFSLGMVEVREEIQRLEVFPGAEFDGLRQCFLCFGQLAEFVVRNSDLCVSLVIRWERFRSLLEFGNRAGGVLSVFEECTAFFVEGACSLGHVQIVSRNGAAKAVEIRRSSFAENDGYWSSSRPYDCNANRDRIVASLGGDDGEITIGNTAERKFDL